MAIESLKTRFVTKSSEEKDNKKVISHIFEKHCEFQNFFRFNNISNVLNHLERCNFFERKIKLHVEPPQKRGRQSITLGNFYF
jgi:hypothetical protein